MKNYNPSPTRNNSEGSSSILVIIMMVVLMVFGLAILTTSLSNMRLSKKKIDWMQDYYHLETQVEEELAIIDSLLILSSEEALDTYQKHSLLEDKDTLSSIYLSLAKSTLLSHIAGDTNASLMIQQNNTILTFDKIDHSASNNGVAKYITVALKLELPEGENLDENGQMIKRYSIQQYYQWQDAFEYEEGIDFGDPFENITD